METIEQVKPEDLVGPLHSSPIVRREPKNPIFAAEDVPYPSVIAYNAGVAYSDDGISNWRGHPKPIIQFQGGEDVKGSYDPRVTILGGRIYITYAMYTKHGYHNNVIFPGGLIIEDDGEVKIYYGAADTVQCLATTQLDQLIDFCLSFR